MWRLNWFAATLGIVLAGCGASKTTVSGTVRFDGRPLPSGTVMFYGPKDEVRYGSIHGEGKYTVEDAPVGTVKITVQTHDATPRLPQSRVAPTPPPELAPRPEDRRDARAVSIPAHYKDPEKSGLTLTVRNGTQKHDIELKP